MKVVYQFLNVDWNNHLDKTWENRNPKINETRLLVAANTKLLQEHKKALGTYYFNGYITINSETEIKEGVATSQLIKDFNENKCILDSHHLGGKQSFFVYADWKDKYIK